MLCLAVGLLLQVLLVGHQALRVREALRLCSLLSLWCSRPVFNGKVEAEALDELSVWSCGVVALLLQDLIDQTVHLPVELALLIKDGLLSVEHILDALAVNGTSDAAENSWHESFVEELVEPSHLTAVLEDLSVGMVVCSER